jgi:hypothetical protein
MENKKRALARPSLRGVANLKVRLSAKAHNVRQQSGRASGLLRPAIAAGKLPHARNDGIEREFSSRRTHVKICQKAIALIVSIIITVVVFKGRFPKTEVLGKPLIAQKSASATGC